MGQKQARIGQNIITRFECKCFTRTFPYGFWWSSWWCSRKRFQYYKQENKQLGPNALDSTSFPSVEHVFSHQFPKTVKYLVVHINKLDWTNTDVLYKKGQSRLHLLRRLRSIGKCRTLLKTFYDAVVASALFYTVVCWGGGCTNKDRRKI